MWNLVKCLQGITAEGSGCEPAKLLRGCRPRYLFCILLFFLIPCTFFWFRNYVRNISLLVLWWTVGPLSVLDWRGPSQVFQDVPVLQAQTRSLNTSVCWEAQRVALWDPEKLFCLRFQAERTVKSAQTLFHLHNPQVIISWDSVVSVTVFRSLLERRPRANARTCPLRSGRKLLADVKSFLLCNLDINAAAFFKVMKESPLNSFRSLFPPTCGLISCPAKAANDVRGQCLQIEKLWSMTTRDVAQYSLLHAISRLSVPAPPFFNHCTYKLVSLGCCKVFSCNYCGLK